MVALSDNIFNYADMFFIFPYSINDYTMIINGTYEIISYLQNYLNNESNNIIIRKILHKYENKDIQNKINKIYNDIFIKNIEIAIKNSNDLIDLIIKSVPKIKENYNNSEKRLEKSKDIYIKFENNKLLLLNITCLITDLYFLRRFLDKSYIKNGIIYTGITHIVLKSI